MKCIEVNRVPFFPANAGFADASKRRNDQGSDIRYASFARHGHKMRQVGACAAVRRIISSVREILCIVAMVTLLCTLSLHSARADEYRVAPGDTIEFSTVATPDLKTRATIRLDGEVTLPLIGDVKVDGLTLAKLRSKLQGLLASKVYRKRSEDGREVPVMLAPDEISVTVAEYRPIYINGDVSKPGEQQFRPGMTVRQAIALAGGYDVMHFRMKNPFLEQADFQAEYNSLWTEYAKNQAIVARIHAELDNADAIDRKSLRETPLPEELTTRIVDIEQKELAARNSIYDKDQDYLKDAVKKEGARIGVLAEQEKREKEGVDADVKEYDRVNGLYEKRTLPITRLVDARRTILFSSTRYLQTIVEKGRAERGRDELVVKLKKLPDERRKQLLADLQDANVKLATTQARLQGVSEKLIYTGLVRSQLVRGKGSEPAIVIHRSQGQSIAANQDNELMPGDVVDVSLRNRTVIGEETPSGGAQTRQETENTKPPQATPKLFNSQ
jgi:polysaccharide export outer membrane protein